MNKSCFILLFSLKFLKLHDQTKALQSESFSTIGAARQRFFHVSGVCNLRRRCGVHMIGMTNDTSYCTIKRSGLDDKVSGEEGAAHGKMSFPRAPWTTAFIKCLKNCRIKKLEAMCIQWQGIFLFGVFLKVKIENCHIGTNCICCLLAKSLKIVWQFKLLGIV